VNKTWTVIYIYMIYACCICICRSFPFRPTIDKLCQNSGHGKCTCKHSVTDNIMKRAMDQCTSKSDSSHMSLSLMLSSKQQKIAFNCKEWELIELIGMRINRCIPFSGVSELKDVLFYMWLLYSVSVVFLNTRVRPTQKLFFCIFK